MNSKIEYIMVVLLGQQALLALSDGDRPFYKPAYQGTTVQFDCTNFTAEHEDDEYKFVTWETPSGNKIVNGTRLTIPSVTKEDAGQYTCLLVQILGSIVHPGQDPYTEKKILRQVYEIPYVIVPKDYVQATWVALLFSGAFLAVCIGLMLLSKYTYENRMDTPKNDIELVEGHNGGSAKSNLGFQNDDPGVNVIKEDISTTSVPA